MGATVDHEELPSDHNAASDTLEMKEKADTLAADPGIEIDAATNKRLFWKITRRILVIQVITYFCQSLDKGILNYASIMGIKTDAHLVGQEVGHFSPITQTWSLIIARIVFMAGNHPLYRHSCGRVPSEFPVAKVSLGEDALHQCVSLGRCSGMFCCFDPLCIAHGCSISVGFLRKLCPAGYDAAVSEPLNPNTKFRVAKYYVTRTAMWYKREEQSVLNALWYCMSGVSLMVIDTLI
jgi:hypothetical protein